MDEAFETNYDQLVYILVSVLENPVTLEHIRNLAGLQLKNLLKANDESIKQRKLEKWNSCDPAIREQVRDKLLATLSSTIPGLSKSVAQAVAAFAAVEIPLGGWPTVLPQLIRNISDPGISLDPKVASLEALGFMCEAVDIDDIEKVEETHRPSILHITYFLVIPCIPVSMTG